MREVILLAVLYYACAQNCPGQADYKETKNNVPRLTTILQGNFTIQALITMSVSEPIPPSKACSLVSKEGVIRAFAMRYALDKFNNKEEYTRFAKIGLQIDDVCKQLPTTMARGIEVIYFHRPKSVCRADFLKCDATPVSGNVEIQRASALIGTAMSFTTIPLASLMSLYSIPQVSPGATSRLLSKKNLYKSFFRTIPSDTNQVRAMLAVFKRFGWNYIFAVGSDDDYGKLGVSELKQEAAKMEICIPRDEYVPFQSDKTKDKVKSVVEKIKKEERAKVVVLFLYAEGLGDKILEEAQKQGVQRVWLTSESWNPSAATILSKRDELRNQTHGILSISMKKHPMTHLIQYMKSELRKNWECNFWLKRYLHKAFSCEISGISSNGTMVTCKDSQDVSVESVMDDLKKLPGNIDRLIDATRALAEAMHRTINQICEGTPCYIKVEDLPTANITEQMKMTDFVNEQGETVSFDSNGDPKTAFYTIENLVYNPQIDALEFVPIGNWTLFNQSKSDLHINESLIQWPSWFNYSRQKTDESKSWVPADYPASRCSDRCAPGYKVVGRSTCCWDCHRCSGNNHTSKEMEDTCIPCGDYHHADENNIKCIETPIEWLKIDDPAGLSIVIISGLGIIASLATCIFMYRFWDLVTVHEKSKHLLTFICVLLLVTFVYGPLHIIEPTSMFCGVRNGYFFVLLMVYTSFVLTKTQAMCSNIQSYCDRFFRGNMTATQFFVLFLFVLLELASIAAWIYLDEKQIREFRTPNVHLIKKQCEVEFTAARLVSTFIPCIILIIATFCAFRERNSDHSFYEPKFLSFSCIALCIIIVAFLPTYRYVDSVYKAVVLAFTMNVFGFTFIACLILPKVYVGVVRKKRGIEEYPMKPGVSKKEKKEKKEKKKQEKEEQKRKKKTPVVAKEMSTNMTSSFKTASTVEDDLSSTVSHPAASAPTKDAEAGIPVDDEIAEDHQEETEQGYSNATFIDEGEIEIESGSPPPSYESSIKRKGDEEVC